MTTTTTKRLCALKGKMTLRLFADKLGVGQSTLHNYLKGRDPKASFIAKVCLKTGCDANWLLGIKSDSDASAGITVSMLRAHVSDRIKADQQILEATGV